MVTTTQSLSDDMIELFAAELGASIRLVDPGEEKEARLFNELLADDDEDEDDELQRPRPPVITVMGHVSINFVVKTAYASGPLLLTIPAKGGAAAK